MWLRISIHTLTKWPPKESDMLVLAVARPRASGKEVKRQVGVSTFEK